MLANIAQKRVDDAQKQAPTKKTKTDPKKFELFLNDLDELCN